MMILKEKSNCKRINKEKNAFLNSITKYLMAMFWMMRIPMHNLFKILKIPSK